MKTQEKTKKKTLKGQLFMAFTHGAGVCFIGSQVGSQVSFAEPAHDCICPHDETILVNPGVQSCGQIKCPACGHLMVRALYVGTKDAKSNAGIQSGSQRNSHKTRPSRFTYPRAFHDFRRAGES